MALFKFSLGSEITPAWSDLLGEVVDKMQSKSWRRAGGAFLAPIALLIGCANPKSGSGSGTGTGTGTSTVTYPDSTGNWLIQATATSGSLPFSQLRGFINEQQTGTSHPTTGAFQVDSTGCFAQTEVVPMEGVVQGLRLHIVSFGLDQQVLDLSAAKDTTSTHFTGTYAVTGGSCDGAAGGVTGTRYTALTGTYAGTVPGSSPSQTITLKLTQFGTGTGAGQFLLSGSAAVTGLSCLTTATLASTDGAVSGNQVQMHFKTSAGTTMDVTGTFDSAALAITVSNAVVGGTGCSANLGQLTLSKA
jgi:hypothetical protein